MRSRLKWMGTAALALCLAGTPVAFAAGGGFRGGSGGFHGGGGGGWRGGGGGWHGGGWHGGGWYGGGWGYGGWGYPYWGWGDYGWGSPYLYGTPYSYGYAYEPPPQPDGGLYCVTRAHMCGLDDSRPPGSRCACSGGRGKVMVLQGQ